MRFKFELSANGGTVPILVTTEATATVADLAGDAVGAYAITPATIARLNGGPA